jgi:tetratricopeptide (TPR) repeat protein
LANFHLAEVVYAQRGASQAVIHWRAAQAGEVLYRRGASEQKNAHPAEAESWASLTVQIDPTHWRAWLLIARAQAAQKKWESAAATYTEIIRRFPEISAGYEGLAGVLIQNKELERARQVIKQGLAQADAAGADLYYLRSRLAADRQDYPSAEADARRAIELAPTSGGYLAWLGDLYLRQKRYTEALAQYELAGGASADPSWIWRSRQRKAQVLAVMGDGLGAVEEQRASLQLSLEGGASTAQVADNYVYLGDLLLSIEDIPGAAQAYREALRLAPDHPTVITKLQGLGVDD